MLQPMSIVMESQFATGGLMVGETGTWAAVGLSAPGVTAAEVSMHAALKSSWLEAPVSPSL